VADVRTPAKIDPKVKFMGLRHGGNAEGADADLSDAQLRVLSGHKSPNMVVTCTQATMRQRREEAEATQGDNERRFTVGITPLLPVGMRGFKG
jgi:hypothetical protein